MMVVLVITLIVVGLAFSILNLVQRQMGGIAHNYEQRTATNLLRQALWVDFNTYSQISFDAQRQTLDCRNAMGGVQYRLEHQRIIREKDTFDLEIRAQQFYFDGKEFPSGNIDAIRLSLGSKGVQKSLFVYRENAAEKYLN